MDNLQIKGFVNNSRATNKQYPNIKTECGYLLAENIKKIWFKADVGEETKESIEQELAQLKTYNRDKDNKLMILPKEKIKDNIGRSPDWLDVFIMRQYFELNSDLTFFSGAAN